MEKHLEALRAQNYSPFTVKNRRVHLGYFVQWCRDRGITEPTEVTRPILEHYQRHLFEYRKKNGEALSFRSQHARLMPLRVWFRWLARQHYLLHNPASEIELPRLEHRLPKHVLSVPEVEQVLAQPAIHDPLGLRDRAILETLYSTGIRRMELVHLKIYDLDPERGTLMIRQGKGKKDRVIPIGERALAWVEKYLPRGAAGAGDRAGRPRGLPLATPASRFCLDHLSNLVRDYVDKADIGKRGACHLFRHTMATLMLEDGADIRFIQQMLGHADLNTTQIYTHVSIRKLKEIHTATHPARLERKSRSAAKETPTTGRDGFVS